MEGRGFSPVCSLANAGPANFQFSQLNTSNWSIREARGHNRLWLPHSSVSPPSPYLTASMHVCACVCTLEPEWVCESEPSETLRCLSASKSVGGRRRGGRSQSNRHLTQASLTLLTAAMPTENTQAGGWKTRIFITASPCLLPPHLPNGWLIGAMERSVIRITSHLWYFVSCLRPPLTEPRHCPHRRLAGPRWLRVNETVPPERV